MSQPGFVHLHLHSEYSLLDGANRIPKLVKRVKDLGMEAVALTDHGNLFGAVALYRACRKAGIKPILGIEAYVAPDVKTPKSDRRHKEAQGVADGGFHLVLLAESLQGWQNLMRLSSDSFIEGFYYKPRMDKDTLTQWNDGLIAINGHLGSSIAYYLTEYERTGSEDYYEQAKQEAMWHASVFAAGDGGEPRFYLELQRHETPEQDAVNYHVLRLAEETSLPLVCDNDAHFMRAEDWDAHDTLVCVSTGKLKQEAKRLHYPRELFVKGPEAMSELFADVPEALANTARIAERCNVDLDFSANHAPLVGVRRREPDDSGGAPGAREGSSAWYQRFCSTFELVPLDSTQETSTTPEEIEKECDEALRELAEKGLVWRYGAGGVTDEHRARLDRELQVLSDKKISAYFLIVWDFVNEARRRGIPAMARGSGVGTMVGYVIGLSNACPVKYGLLFERFTDPDRSEYPDIDIDLCQDGRQEILDYVRDKYGYVAQIITFGTMKARAAVRDVGRVLDLPLADVDKICKLIGDQLGITLADALDKEPELEALYKKEERIREVIDTAKSLEGMVRHSGVHAAGVVIATEPLENLVPLAITKHQGQKEILVTQWDGPTVENMGLLKMDFLGLKTLSVLERARVLVRETLDEKTIREAVGRGVDDPVDPLDLDRIDFTDRQVLELYQRGETTGTFQFESDGMRNMLLQMKPDRLEDLVAGNALFRPGPMALIGDYCKRKHGQQPVPKVHEIVDRYTADTYGIMVYQEQVMQIVHELGGIPLRDAYSLIKAISKKKHGAINAARARFLKGAQEKGLSKRKGDDLFDLILRFAGYGFNKSHSVGYSILAFQTAFMKTYFPIQYMAAVLTYEADNTDKLSVYLDEAKRVRLPDGERGVVVQTPDINLSGVRFDVVYDSGEERTPAAGHVRFGLSAVKGVGGKAVEAILETRRDSGAFESLYDFCERVPLAAVNRSTIEALIKAGAFDSVHGMEARAALAEALDQAIRSGQRAAADRESGQTNLFGTVIETPDDESPAAQLPEVEPWSVAEQLKHEKAALGFFASRHPLEEHREALARYSTVTAAGVADLEAKTEIILGAIVSSLRTTRTRKGRNPGQKMGMLTLEDGTGKLDAVAFSETFAKVEPLLAEDAVLFFRGQIDRRREEPNLVISHVITPEQAVTKLTERVRIVLEGGGDEARLTETSLAEELAQLREILDRQKMKVNGSLAEVEFEIHLEGAVVRTSTDGYKIPVDPGLPEEIAQALKTSGRCDLVGPPKLV